MIDIKLIRENKEFVKNGISKKNVNPLIIDEILEIDEKRREKIKKLNSRRLTLSQGFLKQPRDYKRSPGI